MNHGSRLDEGEGQEQHPEAEEALRVVRVDERDRRPPQPLASHQRRLPPPPLVMRRLLSFLNSATHDSVDSLVTSAACPPP